MQGGRPVTWSQLLVADKALFTYAAEQCPSSCRPKPGASQTEFEAHWKAGMFEFEVLQLLQPCVADSAASSCHEGRPTTSDQHIKKLENQLKNLQKRVNQKCVGNKPNKRRKQNKK